ncbi:MAG: hypothetical protein AB8G11_05715 [Saprospiraceae bacterium]
MNFLFGTLFIMTFWGCNGNNYPDVSDINVTVNVQRFEQELFQIDTNDIIPSLNKLNKKYDYFADLYFSEIMRFKRLQDTTMAYATVIPEFISYPSIRELYDTCQLVYGDLSPIEKDFEKAFQFYNYYFPNKPTPMITTFISEYGIGAATIGEEQIIIGLDMFLGEDYQPYYYSQVQLPNYITRTMNRQHIVPKAMEALAREVVGQQNGLRLIDKMIQNGKALYILDLLQPHIDDYIKLGITKEQAKWLPINEAEMWKTVFIDKLYDKDLKKLRGLIEVAPTSPGMPLESPGNAGSWVGWQIIKAYMDNNPNITLKQMLEEHDAQKILTTSRYKPR